MKKKSTPKNSKPSTKRKSAHKGGTCGYRDNLFGGFVSWGPDFHDHVAQKLAHWAFDNRDRFEPTADAATTLQDFYFSYGIPKQTFYNWLQASANLREARDFAVEVIGAHRERGGLFRKMDTALVAKTMAKYDIEDRKLEKWRIKLKAKAAAQEESKKEPTTFNIVMKDYSKKPLENDKKSKP
jgi:hypothetical protein